MKTSIDLDPDSLERLAEVHDPFALLAGIFAHSPVALQIYRADGRCLFTNRACEKLFGARPPPYNILCDDSDRERKEHLRRAFRGETVHAPPVWHDRREGGRVAIGSTLFPLLGREGAVEHVAVVFEDLARPCELQEQPRDELRLRYQATVLRNLRDSVIVTDLTGRIVDWNEGATSVFGYESEEAIGRSVAMLYPEEDPRRLEQDLARILEGHDHVGLWRGQRKDGSTVWVDIKTTVMRDGAGKPIGFVGIGKDVTDKVQAEEERAAADREREQALKTAEQASRTKDEFLAMLGHELRNPLAPIVTALHLVKLKEYGAVSREIEVIERQVEHLVRMVDDLLEVSRITRGRVTLSKSVIDLQAAVTKAIEMAAPLLEQRRHHLSVDLDKTRMRLDGDVARLAQVLSNLLTNAAKYTEPGGNIALSARRKGERIVISVRDDGIGIDPELLPKIFEPFVQGQRSIARAEGGLGIGLMLVKSLVELHGGRVEARSQGRGKGSEFIVELPALPATRGLQRPSRAKRVHRTPTPRKIIVVDDNADAAELLAAVLRLAGHEVRVAHDGPATLDLVESFVPEIALLDIGLPVMDGYELAARLRAVLGDRTPRLIAVTGYGQSHDRARSYETGFDDHFVKPVEAEQVLMSIDQLAAAEHTR